MRDLQKSLTFYASILFFSFVVAQDPWYKPNGYIFPQLREWNAQLDASEQRVLRCFTPEAQEILRQSPLRHHWLGPNKVIKNEIPAGEYCIGNNARRIDRKTLDAGYIDDTVFHESVHALPFSREEFERIYGAMNPEEWPIKAQVEEHIGSKYDPAFADLMLERIAYIAQYHKNGKAIPDEMERFLSRFIETEIQDSIALRK